MHPRFRFVVPLILALSCGLSSSPVAADLVTQTGVGGAVPDNTAAGATFDVTISDTRTILPAGNNVTVTLENFQHTFLTDLTLKLEHVGFGPQQLAFDRVLKTGNLGSGIDFNGTYSFNSGAATRLRDVADTFTSPIPSGTYQTTLADDTTNSNLSSFWNGQTAAGTWRLFISDRGISDITNTTWTWRVDVQVVPEPSAFPLLSLVGVGVAAIVVWRKRGASPFLGCRGSMG
ncbi:MAG: PEP-CTERM sorting domain-containing protein [Planctomycetales bacterium]|nr:PEP-CTERM sorting domain-containing protein [Planctomycetales bacterium]